MLTVDFAQFPVSPGDRVLDLGCGGGRHAFELYRRGAHVVAFDHDGEELAGVETMFRAMEAAGEPPPERLPPSCRATCSRCRSRTRRSTP